MAFFYVKMPFFIYYIAMKKGVPYDIPDFRREEDCKAYENNDICPIPHSTKPADYPTCSHPDYKPDEESFNNYLEMVR